MKKAITLFVFFWAVSVKGVSQIASSKKKAIVMEKTDIENIKGIDDQMKNDMSRFLGFGMHIAIKNTNKVVVKTAKNDNPKPDFVLQMGFQLPEFIRTNPPDKVFKIGWAIGFNK